MRGFVVCKLGNLLILALRMLIEAQPTSVESGAVLSKGMYTGKVHSILLCALTVTEVHNLKAIVAREDPKAVVIVSPAQEILGGGFAPLEEQ